MENLNIPIYRALKLDTKDEYVDGYLFKIWENYYIQWGTTNGVPNQIEIDPSTLAINFPDMKDSEDNPIFASLRSDGKGGDILNYEYYPLGAKNPYYQHKILFYDKGDIFQGIIKEISGYEYKIGEVTVYEEMKSICQHSSFMFKKYKVIGIQK